MKCPNCGSDMIIGYYKLKSDTVNFMMFGASSSDLYFLNDEYEDKMVLPKGKQLEGYFCNNCYTKVILNNEPGGKSDPKVTI